MPYTKTEICNMALAHIGVKGIAAFGESSVAGRQCSKLYAAARDFVLRDHEWGFAERRVAASLLSDEDPIGYEYAYQYPADCLKIRRLWQTDESLSPIKYKKMLGSDNKTQIIATNEAEAYLVYTVALDSTASYDISFVTALSWKLASDLAVPLSTKKSKAVDSLKMYSAYIAAAQASDSVEEQTQVEVTSSFEEARR